VATIFPKRARRGDANGYMVVQEMLDWLRDLFDGFTNRFRQGTATVPQAATFVDVVHGLGQGNHQVLLTPLTNPAADWWVSSKSATQFRINLSVAAPVGGITFDYLVKGA
jgi:hypothetical protein